MLKRVSAETRKELIEMSSTLVADPPLKPDELQHCRSLVQEGFHYFGRLGWTQEQEANFLSRPRVKQEMDRLLGLLQDSEGLAQRSSFFARVDLYRMLPAAVSIVAKTLRGLDGGRVNILDMPTEAQYEAAKDVIRWCGLTEGQAVQVNVTNNSIILPQIERGASDAQDSSATSTPRERYNPEAIIRRNKVQRVIASILTRVSETEHQTRKIEKRLAKMDKKKKNKGER